MRTLSAALLATTSWVRCRPARTLIGWLLGPVHFSDLFPPFDPVGYTRYAILIPGTAWRDSSGGLVIGGPSLSARGKFCAVGHRWSLLWIKAARPARS
jgi:hypothetical protein